MREPGGRDIALFLCGVGSKNMCEGGLRVAVVSEKTQQFGDAIPNVYIAFLRMAGPCASFS